MNLSRRLQAITVIASLILSASVLTFRGGQDFDLVASANPATPGSSDTDRTAMFERARGKRAQADAVATASATCDSCSASASAVQVIYVNKAKKRTADNVANAWSSCSNCRATSVSVQVIVVRPGATVTARNRAFAVNAACSGCTTSAVAVQIVVVTSKHRAFSRHGRQQLEAMARELEAQLSAGSKAARLTAAKSSGLTDIEALVRKELKPTSLKPQLTVKTG
ncbi:hypothetical protein E0H73_41315 [Kribbella pittospori]|uniref:Uncharacterized protein n=1 Tax=Kribbella pittospori TaxID=722689 RepID=A0A4R0JYU1_9ACTN|nr:hypothetical protein [Kribbella pittospori]TCC50508.1 hypothetical protein E0H73_41315 [Kribbella pittospori]